MRNSGLMFFLFFLLPSICLADANVCSRSPQIKDYLEQFTHRPCAEITNADLAEIGATGKGVFALELDSLKAGDFEGLTAVKQLQIRGEFSEIPAGTFAGMTTLQKLNPESSSDLGFDIAVGAFDGLPSLKELEVTSYSFEDVKLIRKGAFRNLSNLVVLQIWITALEVEDGLFQGLENLQELDLEVGIANIPENLFEGLPKLSKLYLAHRASQFPPNLFEPLPQLKELQIWGREYGLAPLATPPNFSHLKSLEFLELQHTGIQHIPAGWLKDLTQLRKFHVTHHEQFSVLPDDLFSGLINLQEVSLSRNQISEVGPAVFASENFNSTAIVYITENPLTPTTTELLRTQLGDRFKY